MQHSSISPKYFMMVFANGWPIEDPLRTVDQKWLKKLQSDSNGRLQIAYLDISGKLDSKTGSTAGFQSWQEEREHVDMFWGTSDMHYANLPIQRVLRWFMYGTDIRGSLSVYNKLMQEFPEMEAEFTSIGVKRLCGFAGIGVNIQTGSKPVRCLDDLKGLRLSFTGTSYEIFKHLGASEVEVYQGEEYTSVARGQADGTIGYIEFLKSFPDADCIRYTTLLKMPFPAHDFYGMNLKAWNSLPVEMQKVFQDSAQWFYDEMTGTQVKVTKNTVRNARAKGHEFIDLPSQDQSRFFALMEEVALKKVKILDAEGIPATRIFKRTRQLINQYVNKTVRK
jgi:TRAP-type transport system periplasmic protein